MIRIEAVSENTLIIYFADSIQAELSVFIGVISQQLKNELGDKLIEVIPSYTSIFIQFDILRIDLPTLSKDIRAIADTLDTEPDYSVGKLIELPTWYHSDVAPDLKAAAQHSHLSVEEFISIHSNKEYRVCAIGFAPGFAFLGSVDSRIELPRHDHPKAKVSRGSVGIAGLQTAVYPQDSPGGWQIIGNCPLSLFDPDKEPMTPFQVGDKVRFHPISKSEFLAMDGQIQQENQ
ncbi:5-oxoprolinase subunit PxpB [Parendozoicomonas sp. Alg238-R29]|uniref:5-oxoprolinase subunit PxpB n=1 Tax=Parendozoicomonas sp. Alg238-R29 TaxID=2993446 RepID=UPI00248EF596|nr:5-oxoprolinase subunit PxpB [Parendozoicomonas sp. Alg238-R29]